MVSWERRPQLAWTSRSDRVAATGVSAPGYRREDARSGAGTAFEFITDHSGSAADTAFGDRASFCTVERARDILWFQVEAIDVVQPAVPRLRHDRQAPPVTSLVRRPMRQAPGDDRVARHADTVGVRNYDRPFEESAFLHPGRAGHFAIAVQAESAGVNRIVERVMAARNNRGHAGAHRAFADFEFSLAADQSRKTDFDPGDVGDRI